MDHEKIRNDEDFHKWHEYEPNDSQYVRYAAENSSIIAAAHKIVDVYYSFANARCSFMDYLMSCFVCKHFPTFLWAVFSVIYVV